ncbi:lipid-binding SYLF domain-containing protein [Ferruginibacter sp.]
MKKNSIIGLSLSLLISAALIIPLNSTGSDDHKKIINDSKDAKAAFIKTDPSMKSLFTSSYGYAILPNVGKGAVGVGGAAGNGVVYEKGKIIGTAKMLQVSVGFQFGGQAYREVIFFENKEALDHFKNDKIEFAGQVSAIAAKNDASANTQYRDGVKVFTEGKNGLMVEAAIGGQRFTYSAL